MPIRGIIRSTAHTMIQVTLLLAPHVAWGQQAVNSVDLERAVELARRNNPMLRAAHLQIDEAKGDLIGASIRLLENTEVGIAVGPRFPEQAARETRTELGFELSQSFEIGGQRDFRIARANEQVAASEAGAADAARVIELAVVLAFSDVLAAQERVAFADESAQLATDLLDIASRRVEAGAEPPLELNGARIRYAEAQRTMLDEAASLRAARLRLALLLDLPLGQELTVVGDLAAVVDVPSVEELVATARRTRPDIVAAQHRQLAAVHAVDLADAEGRPDLKVGVGYEREEGDNILLGAVSISLPFSNRNQGERATTRATLARLQVEQHAVAAGVEAEIRESYARFEAAARMLQIYGEDVLAAQEENLQLIRTMFDGGKIGYAEVVLLQRELVQGRLGYLETRLRLARDAALLRASAGLDLVGNATGRDGQ